MKKPENDLPDALSNAEKTVRSGVWDLHRVFFEDHQITVVGLCRHLRGLGYAFRKAAVHEYPYLMYVLRTP